VSVERAEAGWDRADPPPRWRALLDRALPGREAPVREEETGPQYREPRPDGIAGRGRVPDQRIPDQRIPEQRGSQQRGSQQRAAEPRRLAVDGRGAPPAPGYPSQIEWQPVQPSPGERLVQALRRDLGRPRVIAFANPKGGVHKTTATVLCAATIGGVRRRGVIAWDDNELRGTLGLRAGSARHARTIRHLVTDLALIEATSGTALTERLDDYLRHASDGSYDVLAGEESPSFARRLDPYTVRRVLELLCRTHDVVCVDTGNNVESANWQTVLQATDQLVLTSVPREDAAFTADWMLDLLHEMGMSQLADEAVTLLSCPTPNPSPLIRDLAEHFSRRTRSVVVVPYDPALESGSSIEYHQLQPATKRAWLEASAVIVERF
jgi:MinD-like ATPase involved in chromosome partitioning or flagellar assembly